MAEVAVGRWLRAMLATVEMMICSASRLERLARRCSQNVTMRVKERRNSEHQKRDQDVAKEEGCKPARPIPIYTDAQQAEVTEDAQSGHRWINETLRRWRRNSD